MEHEQLDQHQGDRDDYIKEASAIYRPHEEVSEADEDVLMGSPEAAQFEARWARRRFFERLRHAGDS